MIYGKVKPPEGSGDRLRAARRAKHLKVKQVADMLGVGTQSVYNYEAERWCMNVATCMELCELLDISPNYLLRGDIEDGQSE